MHSTQMAAVAATSLLLGWSPALPGANRTTPRRDTGVTAGVRRGTSSLAARQLATGDACALVTPAEVSAALGITVLPGKTPPPVNGHPITTICAFSNVPNASIGDKKAVISLITTQSFDIGKTPVQGITKTPVSGIGDEAYFVVTPGFDSGLNVREGRHAMQIRVNGGKLTIAQEEDIEKAIAKAAVVRL